jgi:uncharacterized membrane protein (UPF0127 family)
VAWDKTNAKVYNVLREVSTFAKITGMNLKKTKNDIKKKKSRKKSSLSKLLIIILVSALALAFLIFSTLIPKRNNTGRNQTHSAANTVPSFRKDGNLKISCLNKTSPILLDIEIADEEEERVTGLMYRQTMPENAGMLFIFPNDAPRSFWMKNTYISLDIIYINSRKEIVTIQKYTQPRTTYSIPSEKPAMYVLEVNAGFTDKNGIMPGDIIDF